MAKLSRSDRIKSVLTLLGEGAATRVAAGADISKQMMSHIVVGRKPASDDVYRRIALALLAEAESGRKAAGKLEEIAGRMLAELDGE